MPPQRIVHRALATVAIGVAALMAGCGSGDAKKPPAATGSFRGPGGITRLVRPSELTAAERKYGLAPTPSPSVTYQPDVVIIGGGAEVIRAASPNGIQWTIDGGAPGMDAVQPGKVIFVTSRAVGRVLARQSAGRDVVVTLGPVDIPEVVKNADISLHEPIDFSEALDTRRRISLAVRRHSPRCRRPSRPRLPASGWRRSRSRPRPSRRSSISRSNRSAARPASALALPL